MTGARPRLAVFNGLSAAADNTDRRLAQQAE
jgi:hypothetical protein